MPAQPRFSPAPDAGWLLPRRLRLLAAVPSVASRPAGVLSSARRAGGAHGIVAAASVRSRVWLHTGDVPMAEGDDAIRRWCRDGDERRFEEFYHAHATPLWRLLVLRGVERDDAYDIVAEAFGRFVGQVCKRPQSPRALLYRIALNLATDRFRRQQVRAVADTDPDALGGGAPPPELPEDARRLLAGLDPGERDLLLMRYWLGMTHREVARALDVPEGTVRRRAAGLLNRMRDLIDAT